MRFTNKLIIIIIIIIISPSKISDKRGISHKVVPTVIAHQSHHRMGWSHAALNAPIINHSQHCCVHNITFYNRIQQLVSLNGLT